MRSLQIEHTEAYLNLRRIEERLMAEMYKLGRIDREIADILMVDRQRVQRWRNRMGLKRNEDKRLFGRGGARMRDYQSGLTDDELASKWNILSSSVAGWRANRNLKPNLKDGSKRGLQ